MAGEPQITVVGNMCGDPELRFTSSGAAVASFTIAQAKRTKQADGSYKEGDSLFLRCSAWRELAENIAESLVKGTRVVALGRLEQRTFETREGEKRTVIELQVDSIGPDLRWATAKVSKVERSPGRQNGGQQQRQQPQGGQRDPWAAPPDDPWASTPPPSGGGFSSEPPF